MSLLLLWFKYKSIFTICFFKEINSMAERTYLNEKVIFFSDGGNGGTDFTFNVGNVVALPEGSTPTVRIEKISEVSYSLYFGIPRGSQGEKGSDGSVPSFEIGNVTTLEEGADVTASLTKNGDIYKLNVGIPRGKKGKDAVVPTLEIGTVKFGTDTAASMNYDSSSNKYKLNITIPKGDKGDPGITPVIRDVVSTYLEPGSMPTAELRKYDNDYVITLGIPAGYDGVNGTDGRNGVDGSSCVIKEVNVTMLPEGSAPNATFDTTENTDINTVEYTLNLGIPQAHEGIDGKDGKDGVDGTLPEFGIGSVQSIDYGNNARVTLDKNNDKYLLNFELPKGKDGVSGRIPYIDIGEVKTLPPDTPATASMTDLGNDSYLLNLGIPAGVSASTPVIEFGSLTPLPSDGEPKVSLHSDDGVNYTLDLEIPVGIDGEKGEKGADGHIPTFELGTVETLPDTEPATVELKLTSDNHYLMNFGLPKGKDGTKGEKGKDAILEVGDVTTLGPEDEASVFIEEYEETENNKIYKIDFYIPRGEKGEDADSANCSTDIESEDTTLPSAIKVVSDIYHNSGAFNTKEIFTTSGTFTAKVTGLHRITLVGGGGGGASGFSDTSYYYGGGGGGGGECYQFLLNLVKDEEYQVVIGAGGLGSTNSTNSSTNKGRNGSKSQFITVSQTYQANGGTGAIQQTGGAGGVVINANETHYGGDTGSNGYVGSVSSNMFGLGGKGGVSGKGYGAAGSESSLPAENSGAGGAGGSCGFSNTNTGQNGASGRAEIEYSLVEVV